jgi:cyclopropane-fatty-acyl-phospholipid synthase
MDPAKTLLNPLCQSRHLGGWDRLLASAFHSVSGGKIRVTFPNDEVMILGKGAADLADLHLTRGAAKRIVTGGAMGFAEAYIDGLWSSSDLSALLRVLSRSQRHIGPIARGRSAVLRALNALGHRLRRNTRANARKNIQEHYDLSNELYATFLDPTLTYSSAIFDHSGEDLESAQLRKIDRLIDQLAPGPGDHVLEIGSGWGACAIRLARRTGCRVTSLTLSEEQAAEARRRVAAEGLSERVEIRLQDYRDVEGVFDHIISVEMIEAVGHTFLPGYLRTVDARLKPGGRFALQAITIPDERYESYQAGCDFIRKHIFPGGHLPSPGLLNALVQEETSLRLSDELEFGRDYAETLRRWRDAFLARVSEVKRLGFADSFIRKWHYYLAYCEAGFDTDMIHVRQLIFTSTKPR